MHAHIYIYASIYMHRAFHLSRMYVSASHLYPSRVHLGGIGNAYMQVLTARVLGAKRKKSEERSRGITAVSRRWRNSNGCAAAAIRLWTVSFPLAPRWSQFTAPEIPGPDAEISQGSQVFLKCFTDRRRDKERYIEKRGNHNRGRGRGRDRVRGRGRGRCMGR